MANSLTSISPINGRYQKDVRELSPFFSEEALIKYRVKVEIEYLIALSKEKQIKELALLSPQKQLQLRNLYDHFSQADAEHVKEIEKTTKHDVKAVEYFLRNKLTGTQRKKLIPWIHFALTSEDVNNLAYALMWHDGVNQVYLPTLKDVHSKLRQSAKKYRDLAMLALTHGQPATPTTVGKEFAVFASRLGRQMEFLRTHKLLGKLSGATGTWGAHVISYPKVDWLKFTHRFVTSLGLEPNLLTTQIEPHDSLAESYQAIIRINTILTDSCQDLWQYICRGLFRQKKVAQEVGSSTMPHKINPIYFENAEGNFGLSTAILEHLSKKLPTSRMQRDLSDSTVIRNQGVAISHSLLALKNLLKGLNRLAVNKPQIQKELHEHWEVLAEAIQTILRKSGNEDAYERLKTITQGSTFTKKKIQSFISGLDIPESDKATLLSLTPEIYIGLAPELVDLL